MQTDLQLNDAQRQAVADLLSLFPDCGLHRLHVEELARLCECIGLAADEAERQGWRNGWDSGWRHAIEFTTPRPVRSDTAH